MINERLAQLRQTAARLFPERHLYVRSGGEMRKFVLSSQKQVMFASAAAGVAVWSLVATGGAAFTLVRSAAEESKVALTKAHYERQIAVREAQLNATVAELNEAEGDVTQLAQTVENRHNALAMVLADLQGAPAKTQKLASADPVVRVQAVRADQERLLAQAETLAKTRTERLRLAFRMAGLNPAAFTSRQGGQGGPLVEARDPRALAAVLDVDQDFARRVQRASANLAEMRALTTAADRLPFHKPTDAGHRTSSFGVRYDPFTTRPAFHSGVDFGGGLMTPIEATAPGVVSYAGVRSGYGNTVEVDHGSGLKTRYAHLHRINVQPGQRVALGTRLGGMGNTGRSTGVHLHYEVWMNGRVQNPDRFLKVGDYVQQID
jgi:murein DD-endopeptidase MepM/ murein hydrolase activator NlpD